MIAESWALGTVALCRSFTAVPRSTSSNDLHEYAGFAARPTYEIADGEIDDAVTMSEFDSPLLSGPRSADAGAGLAAGEDKTREWQGASTLLCAGSDPGSPFDFARFPRVRRRLARRRCTLPPSRL